MEIERSIFIAAAAPVDDEAGALFPGIEQIKEKHKRATHNVFAYLINEQVMRSVMMANLRVLPGCRMLEVL